MYAVIVERFEMWRDQWTPKVQEVTRDRPKTLFTRCGGFSENRYLKSRISYRLFGDQISAETYRDNMRRKCRIEEMEQARERAQSLRDCAQELVLDEVMKWPSPKMQG